MRFRGVDLDEFVYFFCLCMGVVRVGQLLVGKKGWYFGVEFIVLGEFFIQLWFVLFCRVVGVSIVWYRFRGVGVFLCSIVQRSRRGDWCFVFWKVEQGIIYSFIKFWRLQFCGGVWGCVLWDLLFFSLDCSYGEISYVVFLISWFFFWRFFSRGGAVVYYGCVFSQFLFFGCFYGYKLDFFLEWIVLEFINYIYI